MMGMDTLGPFDLISAGSLNGMLTGVPKLKEEVLWTIKTEAAFARVRTIVAEATMLVHPITQAILAVIGDTPATVIGPVLQQQIEQCSKPLAFFRQKLSPAQQGWSRYDHRFYALHAAIKEFCHMLKGQQNTLITNGKPVIFASSEA
ncbi:uncharacterized protein LOC126204266 [Schistocerca nitens]|uniref:uncharacterized protein LOC126204266 n=1 Tax=Schistocerca nitens TaxID=7011 RepID=UPI0021193F12|nr:uncharacterized protein LOC126204266 [Schistocerca nitens]